MLRALAVVVSMLAATSAFSITRSSNRPSTTITMMAEKSKSLPFLPQPANIVGMAGDVGFDPFGFSDKLDVRWLREAELKHGMLSCYPAYFCLNDLSFITLYLCHYFELK